ncbi:hypothetical protein [Megasphaera sp.]
MIAFATLIVLVISANKK